MDIRTLTIKRPRARRFPYAMLLVTGSVIVAVFSYAHIAIQVSGSNGSFARGGRDTPTPTPEPTKRSAQAVPVRFRVNVGETETLRIATGADSFIVVAPEIALIEQQDRFTLRITGQLVGETMLVANHTGRRTIYIIEVTAKTRTAQKTIGAPPQTHTGPVTGSATTTYTHGLKGSPALFRQSFDTSRKLSGDRTLRIVGDLSKVVRGRETATGAIMQKLSVDRLSAEFNSRDISIRLMDSQVDISPLTLNNYPLRRVYFSKVRASQAKVASDSKPLEVFAGLARPSSSFFDSGSGSVVGAMIPIVDHAGFSARAGIIHVAAKKLLTAKPDGTVFILDGRYVPTESLVVDGEIEYANEEISSRIRLDLRTQKFTALGEVFRLARLSPLNSIGAQSGKRETEAFKFSWRPIARLNVSAGLDHGMIERPVNTNITDFSRLQYYTGANIGIARQARVDARFTDQRTETRLQGSPSKIEIATRSLSIGNTAQFGRNWSNTFRVRFTSGRETTGNADLQRGIDVRNQFRYSWQGGWAAGFVNYANKTTSLASIIVRNPQVLPANLQPLFLVDPALFLRMYADRLRELLGPIDVPITSNLDAGVRYQQTISRFSILGETRLQSGFDAFRQKELSTSIGVETRLDRANTIQVSGWRSFGKTGRGGVTVSYTHHFGGGDGFTPFRIFSFARKSKLRGRVFHDLNGNGQPEPGEPGVPGIEIKIDSRHTVRTDRDGRYETALPDGEHTVKLVSHDLGVRMRAVADTERLVFLDPGKRAEVNFGVTDHGTVVGRVFNDTADWRGESLNGDLPKHWQTKSIVEMEKFIGSGITPRGGRSVYVKEGIPFIRSQNVYPSGLVLDDVAFITPEMHAQMGRTHLRPSDVLLNITGASIGRSTVVPPDFGEGNVNQHVCIIRLDETALPEYISMFLNAPIGQDLIFETQVGVTREGLNYGQLRSFEIPLPPTGEQKEIVRRVEELFKFADTVEERYKKAKAHTDKLTQSILAKAFRGELVPQDPTDEPASVLLERLKK